MRCSEPGHRAAVAIVAPRRPGRWTLATPQPFPAYTPGVWPGMAMGYLPLASGMAGGLESQV